MICRQGSQLATITVLCPCCQSDNVVNFGKSTEGKQRFSCGNTKCKTNTFMLDYTYNGHKPGMKERIIDMALNASGIPDTARVLKVSVNKVISTIKKVSQLESINRKMLEEINLKKMNVYLSLANIRAEMDEMWSFVGKKKCQCWLWNAIAHRSGKLLAYVFGRRQDSVFLRLQQLLLPFGITQYYTDYWVAYHHHIESRKHLLLRTLLKRLVRKTICFSKSILMDDTVSWIIY